MIDIKERQTGDLPCKGWEGPCKNTNAVRYHMNTVYVINDNNYKNLCPECQEACDEYWDERWKEYYAGIM